MAKRTALLVLALMLSLPVVQRAQADASFSGTWKLDRVDPPLDAGRGGRGGAPIGGPGLLSQAPEMLVIAQTGSDVTVQTGSGKAVYTLDGKLVATPAGDVNALKTRAHWDGSKLHLHFKQGMNFGRDILSVNDNTLTVVRDLESGGGSTTRTLTYSKVSGPLCGAFREFCSRCRITV